MKIPKIALASAVIAGIASGSLVTAPAMAIENTVKSAASASEYSSQDKKLVTSSIRLYAEPDSSSTSLASIPRNSLAYSLGETSGNYTKIAYNGITGWAESRFVKDYTYDAQIEAAIKPGDRTIIASVGVNSKPESGSERITSVTSGSTVYFTGEFYDKFSKIQINGFTGWVESRFVVAYEGESNEESNNPPTETQPPVEETKPESPIEVRNVQITASVGIHELPDNLSPRVSSISRLSYAKATGEEEGKYSEIVYKGAEGWVESRFVKEYAGELPDDSKNEVQDITDARRTITASIRLYEEPEAVNSISSISRNSIATVSGQTSGKYTEVYYDGKRGWVESRFVNEYNKEYDLIPQSYYTDTVNKNDSFEIGIAGISDRFGYIHNSKNTTSAITAKLGKYSEVKVLKVSEGWASVEANGTKGWIKVNSLVKQEKENYDKWRTSTKSLTSVYTNPSDAKPTRYISREQVVLLTGYKTNTQSQIRYRINNTGVIYEGWVNLEKDNFRSYNAKTDTKVPSSIEEKQWKDALPKVCKDIEILKFDIKPNGTNNASYLFSTKIDRLGKNYFEITINGEIDPLSDRGRAIMLHECGHVLMTKYDQSYGRTKWREFLDRGWSNTVTNRVELLADAIADELGADRKSTNVGYTHSFTKAQRQLAKELVDMYAPDGRDK